MNVKLIGKHEKDSRACRDGLALTLNELMAEDKSIVYVDCDLMGCINTKQLVKNYPDRAFEAGIAEGNAAGVAAGLAATDERLVPYGAMTATFYTGTGCLLCPSVLYLALTMFF